MKRFFRVWFSETPEAVSAVVERSFTSLKRGVNEIGLGMALGVFVVVGVDLGRGATNELTGTMQKGLFEEEGNHDLKAAMEAYQSIISRFDETRSVTATAIFRLGECYRKQGKTNEAVMQYQRILKEFADQSTLVPLSQQNLAGLGKGGTALIAGTGDTDRTVLDKEIAEPRSEEELTSSEATELKRIKARIKDSPDLINSRDGVGRTPLHRAADQSQVAVAEFLLANGGDIEAKDNTGLTPLHLATQHANKAFTELLLNKGAKIKATDGTGRTSLHMAAGSGFMAVVELLIARGAEVNAKDSGGATPLHLAAASGYKAVAEVLIRNHADVNANASNAQAGNGGFNANGPFGGPKYEGTPLHIAVERGDESMAKLLIANKAEVDARRRQGETALFITASKCNVTLADFLLGQGADPNAKESGGDREGWTPLLEAVDHGCTPVVALLLDHKANPNARVASFAPQNGQKRQYTPLLIASVRGKLEIVESLLAAKADPNSKSEEGDTPLLNVIVSGMPHSSERVEIVKLLLDHGAEPNVANRDGYTALMLCARSGEQEIVKLLIAHKADLNAKNKIDQTALHLIALEAKNKDLGGVAKLILDAGADPNPIDAQGFTPLRLTESNLVGSRAELAELLRKHGAVADVPDFSSLRLTREGLAAQIVVLRQDTNGFNRFTLFELIGSYYNNIVHAPSPLSAGKFPFPDWPNIRILRPAKGRLDAKQEIPVYFWTATNTFDCTRDMPLEFGDVLEIPEREHGLTEQAVGLTAAQMSSLFQCLTQKLVFHVKGQSVELTIPSTSAFLAGVTSFTSSTAFTRSTAGYLSAAMREPKIQSLLTSSSDLNRVKVKRLDPKTKKTKEIVVDVQAFWKNEKPSWEDLWLRDGDVIEVPDKS